MCLVIDVTKHKVTENESGHLEYEPKVAQKDIKCYKHLTPLFNGDGKSKIFQFYWKKEKIEKTIIRQKDIRSHFNATVVDNGFHGFLRRDSVFEFNQRVFEYDTSTTFDMSDTGGTTMTTSPGTWTTRRTSESMNAKMIIPKGAKFFLGKNGNIVADKMKLEQMFDNE